MTFLPFTCGARGGGCNEKWIELVCEIIFVENKVSKNKDENGDLLKTNDGLHVMKNQIWGLTS